MEYIISGVGLLLFGLTLESITSWIAIRTARKHHPKLWEHSGNPTLLGNGDLISAWPLVKYYRDRMYLGSMQYDDELFLPISDKKTLAFAEKLRMPLVYTYYLAWLSAAGALILVWMSK